MMMFLNNLISASGQCNPSQTRMRDSNNHFSLTSSPSCFRIRHFACLMARMISEPESDERLNISIMRGTSSASSSGEGVAGCELSE
jgi:hypothetical protein